MHSVTRKQHPCPSNTSRWFPQLLELREHGPQWPAESIGPTQHAKGRTGDCPGPCKETATRRNVTKAGAQDALTTGPRFEPRVGNQQDRNAPGVRVCLRGPDGTLRRTKGALELESGDRPRNLASPQHRPNIHHFRYHPPQFTIPRSSFGSQPHKEGQANTRTVAKL